MKVEIHLLSQSKPISRSNVKNTYVKNGLYCIYLSDKVEKYPLENIFRIVEPY